MGESLNQPSRVQDEGLTDCKLLLQGTNKNHEWFDDSTL